MTPKVTVLLPVYNAQRYLREAIESILGQTFTDFEFLIIDDGSTDDSKKIIEKYQKSDGRIRLVSRPNKGFVATLNEGLQEAKADKIVRMDADDISLPERLQKQYDYLQANPDCAVVGCQVRIMDENGAAEGIDPRPLSDRNVKLFLGYGCALSGPTVAFRKDAISKIGGFQESGYPAEDYDCWVRLVSSDTSAELANVPDVLYLYRENSQGISLTNKVAQVKKTIEIGDTFRHEYLAQGLPFLTPAIHEGWLSEANQLEDDEAQEQLRRIYYTIQTWFRNDVGKTSKIRAYLLKKKLERYTKIYNPENMPYIYNQPSRHTFPGGKYE